jgi:aspartate aminotransferase-like enzyme
MNNNVVEVNRIFTPGPTKLSERILNIASSPLPYNRTDIFSQITFEIIEGLKYIFRTNGDVVIFTSSGTGAMEATVTQLIKKNEKVLIINGGAFGQRWVNLCELYEIPYEQIKLKPGQSASLENINQKLTCNKYSSLLINAHETSTSLLHNTKSIGELTHKHGVFFIVDAISTVCADQFLMDEWHVDVAVLSSQKALALPPGLSFLALSPRAVERLSETYCKSFYFNIKEYLSNQRRGQTPFSPAIGLYLMLHDRLGEILFFLISLALLLNQLHFLLILLP